MSVTFNYAGFVAAYPIFADVTEPQAQSYFDLAALYFDNAGWPGALTQAPTLLNLLTAHIAWLLANRDAQGRPSSTGTIPPPAIVGRISSATQGSVSVQAEFDSTGASPSMQWYLQTQYGALYWQLTAPFRSATYAPGPQTARRVAVSSIFPLRGRW